MKDLATGLAVGAMVAVILAGGIVGALEVWGPGAPPPPPAPPKAHAPTLVRIGPDGTAGTAFGDDVENAIVRGSRKYDLCYGELRVQRPSMITTDMPDAYCSVSRTAEKRPWRISTGGWQTCQAVCVRLKGRR